ncbi:phosphoribosylanthranilate isomerase [Nocardia sp. NPDC057668]|uniref:phosphoribosylanthranilate isomerase n=1 Tax=Nocardia sp. NPDC057668 TaxID=3346202 RepID=UPI00366DF64B
MTVRAKICGIRSESDLDIAVAAGADAVGFICGVTHVSEDALTVERARELARRTPPFVTKTLVTHLEEPAEILSLADALGVDAIQVHGLVSDATVRRVRDGARGRAILRAVHVTGPEAVEAARRIASECDGVLLDSRTGDRLGGTGQVHDWSISAAIVRALAGSGCPVILAGGLNPGNLEAAILAVRPFAVDVNTGVESSSGDKLFDACASFVSLAHGTTLPG